VGYGFFPRTIGKTIRKTILLLASTALIVLLASGVALAAIRTGDDERNDIFGTNRADALLGRGGNDFMSGRDGALMLLGEERHDVLIRGYGADRLQGGDEDDAIVEECQFWSTIFLCGGISINSPFGEAPFRIGLLPIKRPWL
jgi:hypothetical protein